MIADCMAKGGARRKTGGWEAGMPVSDSVIRERERNGAWKNTIGTGRKRQDASQ